MGRKYLLMIGLFVCFLVAQAQVDIRLNLEIMKCGKWIPNFSTK